VRISRPAGDTGAADPAVRAALAAYADGTGTEHAALTALVATRLLVPVVAIPVVGPGEASTDRMPDTIARSGMQPGGSGGQGARGAGAPRAESPSPRDSTEMALPTLIGNDGRKAIIAFTGSDTLRRWQQDARPVPVQARRVWAAALSEADAAVIDVAGPVQLVVEGARLTALANGEPPPLPHEDPDIRAEIAAVTSDFSLAPGGPDADIAVTLATTDMARARETAQQIALRLAPRLRKGIEVRTSLSRTYAADSPRPVARTGPGVGAHRLTVG
jgi:type III secretion system (T3SS) SseB-like protein